MAKKKASMDSVTIRGGLMLLAGIIILVWQSALQITVGLALAIWGVITLMKK